MREIRMIVIVDSAVASYSSVSEKIDQVVSSFGQDTKFSVITGTEEDTETFAERYAYEHDFHTIHIPMHPEHKVQYCRMLECARANGATGILFMFENKNTPEGKRLINYARQCKIAVI